MTEYPDALNTDLAGDETSPPGDTTRSLVSEEPATTRWGEDVTSTECQCGALGDETHAIDCPHAPLPDAAAIEGSRVEPSTDPNANPYGDVRRRHLLVLQPLPVYYKDPAHPENGIDFVLQGQMLENDIREAMAVAARRLHDHASKYSVRGYTWNLYDIQYDMPRTRVLSATLVIERE